MTEPTDMPDHPDRPLLPNIILFIPDQWRGKDTGCLGNPVIHTPTRTNWRKKGQPLPIAMRRARCVRRAAARL